MNRVRTLQLKRESLADLAGDDLRDVAGAASVSLCLLTATTIAPSTRLCPSGHTCLDCVTRWGC